MKKSWNSKDYRVKDSLGYWVTLMARKIEHKFELMLKDYNVTRMGYVILCAIDREDISNPSDLASYLGVDRAAITRHLDRLEKAKLVLRKRSAADKRSVTLKLSAKGKDLLPQLIEGSIAINTFLHEALSKSEIDSLWKITKKISESSLELPTSL